jgi:hypothetical protein
MERRPLPRERFNQLVEVCQLKATTYTPPSGFWQGVVTKEAVVDFSKEPNPEAASQCFYERDVARQRTDEELQRDLDVLFVWETRT